MRKNKKILLIPDAYIGSASGAIVTQVAKKLLQDIGYKVSIFSTDITINTIETDGTGLYSRKAYNGLSNWKEDQYVKEYDEVLRDTEATVVFTIGSITNKNLCYLEIGKERGLKVISKIFMQDFFCVKYYANLETGPCTRCLDKNYLEAFRNKCTREEKFNYIKTLAHILIRKRLKNILPKIDYVITSTDEQINFYKKFGIPKEKCIKTSLYFDGSKINKLQSSVSMGDYYACIAQNRVEKGFQFLPDILDNCDDNINIIAVYYNEKQAKNAIDKYGFQPYIDNGILEIKFDIQWGTGLDEILAKSRGIIIPSIWPTTTEFGLLEALGLGKPVFTFDISVHHEEIINGINGFKAPLGDYKTIANQLNLMNKDDKIYKLVSSGAKELYGKMTNKKEWIQTLKSMGL
jgi:glycosyltransferase involved in cell wall biosynthesis